LEVLCGFVLLMAPTSSKINLSGIVFVGEVCASSSFDAAALGKVFQGWHQSSTQPILEDSTQLVSEQVEMMDLEEVVEQPVPTQRTHRRQETEEERRERKLRERRTKR
jgi:hypothetical protein